MQRRLFPFIIPLLVVAVVVVGVVAIGSLLLFVTDVTGSKYPTVFVALGLALGTGAVCMALSFRAAKLPPVELPAEPVEVAPRRRLDLGAGYLVGQFVVIFGLMLVLLFVTLALKR